MVRSEVSERLVSEGSVDCDSVMREMLHSESSAVLRHQIECERARSAKLQRPDVFLSFLLLGLGIGIGMRATQSKPRRSR